MFQKITAGYCASRRLGLGGHACSFLYVHVVLPKNEELSGDKH